MAFKTIILCVSAVLIQSISGQCVRDDAIIPVGYGLAGADLANVGLVSNNIGVTSSGLGGAAIGTAIGTNLANGGRLSICSSSPIAPNGLSFVSKNVIESPLGVSGSLPFLGTVALDGVIPTGGSGTITHGCGNGIVGIKGAFGGINNGLGVATEIGLVDGLGYVDGLGISAARLRYDAGIGLARGCDFCGVLY